MKIRHLNKIIFLSFLQYIATTHLTTKNIVHPHRHIRSLPDLSNDERHKAIEELCIASYQGKQKKIYALVKEGISVNSQDDQGNTPLHYAIESPHDALKTTKLLVNLGANLTISSHEGITPLETGMASKSKDLQDFVLSKIILENKKIREVLADISFVIADLKYNNGDIKICEFGLGKYSQFQGHDTLHGKGKIWGQFWDYLASFQLPMWFLDNKTLTSLKQKKMALEKFEKHGGKQVSTLYQLYTDPEFEKCTQKPVKNYKNITNLQGIVYVKSGSISSSSMARIRKKYPGMLFIDTAARRFVTNKVRTSKLFLDDQVKQFRPKWKTYQKEYSSELTEQILNDFQSNLVVIKPFNAANGWGVIITKRKKLDKILKKIFAPGKRKKPNMTFTWWKQDQHDEFLVEEFALSETIMVNNKPYDGTMRLVFALTYNQNTLSTTFLGGYWKLPPKSLDESGNLMEKHKSKVSKARISAAKIDPDTYKTVTEKMSQLLPKLYAKMLERITVKRSKKRQIGSK